MNSQNLFYAFVHLEQTYPDFYIVPSAVVAEFVKRTHSEWLSTPGKKGQPHNDSDIRIFDIDPKEGYRDAWHLLGLDD